MVSIYFRHKRQYNIYSFLAGALAPFLAGRGFWDLATTAARRRAALVRSFLYLCLLRTALTLCRDLLGPAFMVVATMALAGLKLFLDLLVVITKPLLEAAGLIPTTLSLTSPLYLIALMLVRLQGSVENGFLTPLFFSRKLLLLRMTAQPMSDAH